MKRTFNQTETIQLIKEGLKATGAKCFGEPVLEQYACGIGFYIEIEPLEGWYKLLPIEDGWYWARHDIGNMAVIVKVEDGVIRESPSCTRNLKAYDWYHYPKIKTPEELC